MGPEIENRAARVHTDVSNTVELRNLYRLFGKTTAIADINFGITSGSVFGYIGPNGAGKTTSMRILATLDLPTYGDAFVDGFSVVNDPELVRRRLGFMPDWFGTYRDVSCEEYLDFFARAYGLMGRDRSRRLKWVMDFTGTIGMRDKPIGGLSKGMKQRICLGRAMIHDPKVMILDEPAAGLDPRARIDLRRMIRELADRGKTIMISSHILTELAEVCDTVGIIEQGHILAVGSVEDIREGRGARAETNPVPAQDGGQVPSVRTPATATRVLRLRIARDAELAATWLSGEPVQGRVAFSQPSWIGEVIVDGQMVRCEFEGDLDQQVQLIRELVQVGFMLAECGLDEKSLEDVFLQVTEGLVQ
ncbi:MAG: ABC transporter ATP-binding protein [Planctomycetota bacterium]